MLASLYKCILKPDVNTVPTTQIHSRVWETFHFSNFLSSVSESKFHISRDIVYSLLYSQCLDTWQKLDIYMCVCVLNERDGRLKNQSELNWRYKTFPKYGGYNLFVLVLGKISSVQFSSVAQSCLTLCDPMNCSKPGLPVHQKLLEFTETHVLRVSDAIQPSHPLSSPSPSAPNPSQH